MEFKITLRYYIRAMQETRTAMGELRDTLNGLERRLDALQDEVLPEILAQTDELELPEQ
ncbi:MAG: hypothetical protein IJU18_07750 [Oscillospiraceae bacterium]|nr:hypothetical protein [Oscillospiraceae bacterium]